MGLKVTEEIKRIVKNALSEDIGKGDITTELFIPPKKTVKALIICKEKKAILCGLDLARLTFKLLDKSIVFKKKFKDGDLISKGKIVAEVKGRASSILTSERTALNFLSLLSGIATSTYRFKEKIKPYDVKIMDTRKTHPGLRVLEKYAVRIGGGYNHRKGLDEMVLIKDNHLKVIGGIERLVPIFKKIKKTISAKIKLEVEVKSIDDFKIACKLNPDIIMLDNMSLNQIKKIIQLNQGKIPLEISGNVNLKNIKNLARIGPQMISVGAITHSTKAVDFSLEII